MQTSNQRNPTAFAKQVTIGGVTIVNPSLLTNQLFYQLPSQQSGHLYNDNSNTLTWSTQPNTDTANINQLLSDLDAAETQMTILEAAEPANAKQYTGIITGNVVNTFNVWTPWAAISGDVSAYQTAIPELGIANDFSSMIPTKKGLVIMNPYNAGGFVDTIFIVVVNGTRKYRINNLTGGADYSTLAFPVDTGNTYTFESIMNEGGSIQWEIHNIAFLFTN